MWRSVEWTPSPLLLPPFSPLSCDPCDFKERPAHLVNQRLMHITVTPTHLHSPNPRPQYTLSFLRRWLGAGSSGEDSSADKCGVGAKCPQQDSSAFRLHFLICSHLACVAHYCRSETRITRFCNNFITHMVNGALYALVRKGIDFPH